MNTHIITLTCADRPGIVHAVCTAILELGGNITESAQFSEPETGTFCLRTVFITQTSDTREVQERVQAHLPAKDPLLNVRLAASRPRVLIMVSKHDHCLVDLLYRWRTGDLLIDIPLIVSNHPDCAAIASAHGIEFVHLPVTRETRGSQESQLRALIEGHAIDLVVLARYMQILSDDLCEFLKHRAINIHHSFLPGFKGARPYHQAYERGVKLVGATAHFVTADLDEGPIIAQDVVHVSHAHSPGELIARGRDIERMVLYRAVKYWAEDRILVLGGRTVIFAD